MITDALTGAQVLGLTGWAEARSYYTPHFGWRPAPMRNMLAVMCTPPNRLKANPARFGGTMKDVCLQPFQYSCWNPGGANHAALLEQVQHVLDNTVKDGILEGCLFAASNILAEIQADIVNGATHYYSPASMIPPGRIPDWAVGVTPVATIGGQLFFKDV